MTNFYDILDQLRGKLLEHPSVNTVTTGNLTDIDLGKTTIFPLTHLIVKNATISDKLIEFNVNITCMDIIDQTNDITEYDVFYGNDNTQDVLNTQLNVINTIFSHLKRGDLWDIQIQTDDDITAEPFLSRFENVLAGWEADISIRMINGLNIC